MKRSVPAEKRFWKYVQKSEDGCWEWIGAKGASGYGVFTSDIKGKGAHRFSYRLHYGELPEDLFVCHKCDNRSCVRPDHLFLGTAGDNNADRVAKKHLQVPELTVVTNTDQVISMSEAAVLKGVTLQALRYAIDAGYIRVGVVFSGRRLLNRQDVEKYQPRKKRNKEE